MLPCGKFLLRTCTMPKIVHASKSFVANKPRPCTLDSFIVSPSGNGLYIILSPSLLLSFRKCPCLLPSPVLYRITIRKNMLSARFLFQNTFYRNSPQVISSVHYKPIIKPNLTMLILVFSFYTFLPAVFISDFATTI